MVMNMKQRVKPFVRGCCALLLAFAIAACGAKSDTPAASTTTPGTTTTLDMSAMGVDTKTVAHATWVATAPHNTYTCVQCHAVTRETVCAQSGCHPFSKYTALATNFDHTANKTGEQCNKCHSLTPEPTATDAVRIAGWRENVKQQVSDTKWHTALKGVCLNCHDPVQHNPFNISVFPASHQTDVTRQTACETCHYYKLNSAGTAGTWGGGGHPAVTTGCRTATCHVHTKPATQLNQESGYVAGQHYDANQGGSLGAGPFECEWCHKDVASGGYTSWSLTFSESGHRKGTTAWDIRSCGSCHPNKIP
ncbi:MAG: hypothetical protein HZA03_00280 [Nitrospinae bacterium]|nr:hypothetical protein [Nitrospinota bacterium]